ncbi:DUF6199 family natural product biosynthesis protein [Bifidobacterium vespertilionis]|uniref:DUF6199 domain-containing protein n=1 Tax=Bifidobacterium vespertilionis TaxID=2562524 RepID=A0A5J5E2B6_9BIFI|nr:DUF6199 family natural product biosynthesis protein [Bifidobacterium vespertilionis]KAA8821919.1 hypothetical protein EMO90_01485 [Bifidobacterium vespertilionis]KAA8823290.1 hypothetical protein EM848_06305 [Bifidobacterium vespertilionis]
MSIVAFIAIEVLLLASGLLCLFKTEALWTIEHFLDVRGGEPTDFYLFGTKVAGALLLVGVLVFPLTPPGLALLGMSM